jgi:hypothetical protein
MVTSPDNLISNRLTAATSPVMSEYDSGIQERYSLLARLNRLVEVVLKPESKNAYGICPFIERTLKQLGFILTMTRAKYFYKPVFLS